MNRPFAALACSIAALGAGATVVAGCGAEKAAGVDVAQAAQVTKAKKTAQVQMTMVMSGVGLPKPVTITAAGVTDLTRPRGTLDLDLNSLVGSLGLPASALGGGKLGLQMRFDGAKFYARLPDVPALTSLLGGKHWISADLAELATAFGIDTKGLGGLVSVDPAAQLRTLTATSGLKKVGTETIGGAETTHYRGSYSAKDAIAALPAAQRKAAEDAVKKLTALSPDGQKALDQKQDAELWVDQAGVMRQMKISSSLPSTTGTAAGSFTMNYRLVKFGVPLTVTAPATADTYKVTPEALKSLSAFAPTS